MTSMADESLSALVEQRLRENREALKQSEARARERATRVEHATRAMERAISRLRRAGLAK